MEVESDPKTPDIFTEFAPHFQLSPGLPLNEWTRLVPRPLMLASVGGGRRLSNGPTSEFDLYPAARRGHTVVMIGGFMYLFGGWQEGYRCGTPFQNEHRAGPPRTRRRRHL